MITILLLFITLFNDEKIRFHHFGVAEGLSQNSVLSIVKDHYGFIWVGTEDKLNRFDGKTFVQYQHIPFDTSSLSHNYITTLFHDSKNQLWIGAFNGLNLYKYKSNTFKRFKSERQNDNYFRINKIKEYDNRLYLSTTKGIYSKSLDENSPLVLLSEFGENQISGFEITPDGRLWIGFKNQLIEYSIKEKTKKVHLLERDVDISYISKGNENTIWIGANNHRFFSFNHFKNEVHHYKLNVKKIHNANYITSILEVDTQLWIGTEFNSIHIFKKRFDEYHADEKNIELDSRKIKMLFQGNEGLIWVGTEDYGLNVYNPNQLNISNIPLNKSAIGSNVWDILDYKDNIVISTSSNISFYDKKSLALKEKVPLPFETYIVHNKNDMLYFGGLYSELYSYSIKQKRYKKIKLPFSLGSIYGIKSIGNTLWVSSSNGLITYNLITKHSKKIKLKKDGEFFPYMANEFIFQEKKDTILWIATRYTQTGLIKYNLKTKKIVLFSEGQNPDNSLSSNELFSLFLDQKRNWLWIGGKSGLDIFNLNEQKFYHFYQTDGLPNNTVYTITEDLNKKIWLSTNYGLSHVDIVSVEKVELKFHNYTLSHGLSNLEYNQNSSYIDGKGTLYFGGNKGIDIVTPPLNDIHNHKKRSLIEFIKTDNEILFFPQKYLELKTSSRDVQIGVRQINFDDHSGLKYSLLGDSYSSSSVTHKNEMSFSNLPYGEYTLSIWPEGDEANNSSIIFFIPPYFYEMLWFKCLILTFIVISVLGYFKRQKEYQKKLQRNVEERTKELKEATQMKDFLMDTIVHDMKNPLNSILLLAENEMKGEKKDKVFYFSNQILNLFSDLLDTHKFEAKGLFLIKKKTSVKKSLEKAIKNISYVVREKNVNVQIQGDENLLIYCDLKLVLRVLTNLLTNAIKFSKIEGLVYVRWYENLESTLIEVVDKGIGIPRKSIQYIFEPYSYLKFKTLGFSRSTGIGLTFCKMVVEAHKGRIEVESKLGFGTTFRLMFPKPVRVHKEQVGVSYDFLQKLKKYDVHDSGSILKLIHEYKNSEHQDLINELETILYNGNQEQYESFINAKSE